MHEGAQTFAGKTVLVTGAGGSIGSQLCKIIASQNARELRLLSLSEAALYNIDRELKRGYEKYRDTKITPILGSATEAPLLYDVLRGVDIVIHAAAHKHLPLCEVNPLTAIANNVGSTWRLMNAAGGCGVQQMCLISSDKAVNPSSIMGATKRLAEIAMQDLGQNLYGNTRFFAVRFGNVMDSAGSVLPLWREQIEAGGPLTLTDERCERYFMTIAQACDLVCTVIGMQPKGGVYVLDMGQPFKMLELAQQMIAKASRAVSIKIIGLRPGEKLTEELHYGGMLKPTAADKIAVVEDTNVRAAIKVPDLIECLQLAAQRDPRAVEMMWSLIA